MPKDKKAKPDKKDKKGDRDSRPASTIIVDGQVVNAETNQKVFFKAHLCTLFRNVLEPTESFSKTTAEQVMEKNKKKRQAHGTVYILEDRFVLEKNKPNAKDPFRSWLGYREIEDIQRSKTKPEIFVLSVDSNSGQKYYEVYKCKNKEDSYKFESYVRQSMEDRDYRIRDGPVIDVVPVTNDQDFRRSILDFQTSLDSSDGDVEEIKRYSQCTSPTRPGYYSPIQTKETVNIVHAAPPSRTDDEDTIHINYDPVTRSAWIEEDGPVFMFMVRYPHEGDHPSEVVSDY